MENPMTDIVVRMRTHFFPGGGYGDPCSLADEAANEIERLLDSLLSAKNQLEECLTRQQRLKAINKDLLAALKTLVDVADADTPHSLTPGEISMHQVLIERARAAIKAATSAT